MWWSSGRRTLAPLDLNHVICLRSIKTRINAQLKFSIPPEYRRKKKKETKAIDLRYCCFFSLYHLIEQWQWKNEHVVDQHKIERHRCKYTCIWKNTVTRKRLNQYYFVAKRELLMNVYDIYLYLISSVESSYLY